MPKISRRRKGRESRLGKKKIINTRKLHGGEQADKNAMVTSYETTVKLNWTKSARDLKFEIAKRVAESRGNIEIIIVNNTVELASKIYDELNDPKSNMSIALKLNETTPKQESIALRDKLNSDIKKYKDAVAAAKGISVTIETVDGLMIGDVIGQTYKDLTETLRIDKEGSGVNKGYIPNIITAMKNIYDAIKVSKGTKKENSITVTKEQIGPDAYKFLAPNGFAYGAREPPKESEEEYPGMFAARYFFNKETYTLFENRLKLLWSLKLFERSYSDLLKNMLDLPADPLASGAPPSNAAGGSPSVTTAGANLAAASGGVPAVTTAGASLSPPAPNANPAVPPLSNAAGAPPSNAATVTTAPSAGANPAPIAATAADAAANPPDDALSPAASATGGAPVVTTAGAPASAPSNAAPNANPAVPPPSNSAGAPPDAAADAVANPPSNASETLNEAVIYSKGAGIKPITQSVGTSLEEITQPSVSSNRPLSSRFAGKGTGKGQKRGQGRGQGN
jgi:hypothetical protein